MYVTSSVAQTSLLAPWREWSKGMLVLYVTSSVAQTSLLAPWREYKVKPMNE